MDVLVIAGLTGLTVWAWLRTHRRPPAVRRLDEDDLIIFGRQLESSDDIITRPEDDWSG